MSDLVGPELKVHSPLCCWVKNIFKYCDVINGSPFCYFRSRDWDNVRSLQQQSRGCCIERGRPLSTQPQPHNLRDAWRQRWERLFGSTELMCRSATSLWEPGGPSTQFFGQILLNYEKKSFVATYLEFWLVTWVMWTLACQGMLGYWAKVILDKSG